MELFAEDQPLREGELPSSPGPAEDPCCRICSRWAKWSQSLMPSEDEKKVRMSLVMGTCGAMLWLIKSARLGP
jgi:hypothetical protein